MTRIQPTKITGLYGGIVKLATKRMLGGVPDSIGVMWHHPQVLKDTMSMGRRMEKWDRLDPTLSTLASMAAAATIGCGFCLDFHYWLTHTKGLDEAKAREVPRWRSADVFTPTERRVMEYAEAMCQTSPTVTDELSAALLEDLGPAGLIELTSKVGMMNLTARGNVALGIGSEHYAEACGLQPMAQPETQPETQPVAQPTAPVAGSGA